MSSILPAITEFVNDVFVTYLPNVTSIAFSHPLMFLFMVAVPLVGIGIGIFNRLKSA